MRRLPLALLAVLVVTGGVVALAAVEPGTGDAARSEPPMLTRDAAIEAARAAAPGPFGSQPVLTVHRGPFAEIGADPRDRPTEVETTGDRCVYRVDLGVERDDGGEGAIVVLDCYDGTIIQRYPWKEGSP